MLLKLAARNIRRSVRDYAIYFVTLVFGVAVFYAFNSIGSQQILFDIESSGYTNIFEATQNLLSMFSIVIAFVLGFLIVYANRFLIKRRKHEFGIYLTLGMNPGEVSRIVLYETVLVGLVSLVVGLICGILLSQALSFATAALFNIPMVSYQFVFSENALFLTLLCFVIIYVLVALLNLSTVRRYKLIDLLSARSKSEKNPVRNPWVCLVVFIVSLGVIAAAYWQLNLNGMINIGDSHFTAATALMLVGSLLFFWSLAGFAIAVLQRARGIYLRGLSLFTIRQISSKINTAFLSLWIVCVMLFLSITTFSTGMGLIEVFCGSIEKAAPYDASLRADVYYEETTDIVHPQPESHVSRADAMAQDEPVVFADGQAYDWDIEKKLRASIPTWDDIVVGSAQIDSWEVVGSTYAPMLDETGESTGFAESDESIRKTNLQVTAISQYNKLCEMAGRKPVEMADDEYLILNNMDMTKNIAEAVASQRISLNIEGRTLTPASRIDNPQLSDSSMLSTSLVIVVPDAIVDDIRAQGAIPLRSYLNLKYATPGAEGDSILAAALAQVFPAGSEGDLQIDYVHADDAYARMLWPVTSVYTSEEMISQSGGLRMMITYLALYIGFVFLVATAAVLAIQQLSEAADSQPRYRLLARLGCSERMLNQSLLVQVLVYFLTPLALAIAHSACAIDVLSKNLFDVLGTPVQEPILMAAGFTLVIYGGYFLITYFASRSIVRQAVRE